MLVIRTENERRTSHYEHAAGELVIGRKPGENEPHIRVDDDYVSRRHLLIEQISPTAIRLRNIGRNDVQLFDGRRIATGGAAQLTLPTNIRVGDTSIRFQSDKDSTSETSDASVLDEEIFATISRPISPGPSGAAKATLASLGETPIAAELALWFETLLSVQRSAFGSSEFYQETAQAIVELIGLDRGLVLLRAGEEWSVRATWPQRQTAPAKYSRSVLKHVVAKKRTFFGNPQESISLGASLAGVEAIVGSPIFDAQESVVGMLYGSKDFEIGAAQLNITELQAQLVQLLASSISSGMQRQQMEERLRQSQQLVAVGQVMGYITHDLRGPLGNVRQLVEMLRRDEQQGISRQEQLDFIEEAVGVSLELLNDTLEFCRGQVRVQPRRGRFHELFKKHLRLLRLTLEEYGVALQIDAPADTEIVVDADRMARVLRNLAKNAAEALRRRRDAAVTIGARAAGAGAELWVADNGPGLPDEVRARIFQPFASHGKKGGTGFGLAIAKQLVEAHGGTIEVDSNSQGTRFTIQLPALEAAEQTAAERPAEKTKTSGLGAPKKSWSILLADDSQMNQRVTEAMLSAQGHRVTIAGDGRQALDAWERERFDFILMDVEMPEMDGLAATAAIRQLELQTGGHIPIITMTARAMPGDRERCLEAGADGYLTKPIDKQRLSAALDEFAPKETSDQTKTNLSTNAIPLDKANATPSDDVFSLEAALRLIPGGMEGVKEMAPVLLTECRQQLDAIRAGLAEKDAKQVQRGAHTIKGSAGIFAAKGVVEAARQLEEIGRGGNLSQAADVLKRLETEVDRLRDAISASAAADNN